MLGRVKTSARDLIARNRYSPLVRSLRDLSAFVESAWLNEGSSFDVNGERLIVKRLAAAEFRTAFDVGANFGDWSLAALSYWPNCEVHAFEVAPRTFDLLRPKLSISDYAGRVSLNCAGLSDADGVREMFYYPEHPDLTSNVHRHGSHTVVPFQANLMRGDSYCRQRSIEKIDFLKIDVEGAEHLVLKGMGGYLSEGRVSCVQFEYGAFSIQTRVLLADYYSMLEKNYWIGKIFPSGVEFADYDWRMEDFRFANYCCVSKDRDDLRQLLAVNRRPV